VDDGRLPRPPRRIPAGATPLTQLETTASRAPEPPPRQPWKFGRFLAGFIVVLLVISGGVTAGWWVHAENLRTGTASPPTDPTSPPDNTSPPMDTRKVLDSISPGVVRVLATTCAGTGEATGVLIGGGLVLTAASAIKEPLSIVVMTDDGRVRRANALGVSADGVAILRFVGRLDNKRVPLATTEPDPKAERALIGYTSAGKQSIQSVGTTERPRPLSEVMYQAKLGGAVVDKDGRVVGLVAGDTVAASTIVPLGKLKQYAALKGITAEALGTCARSRGPQNPMVPELLVANTPLALEAQRLLGSYLTLLNRHDFHGLRPLYSKKLARGLPEWRDRRSHQTSFLFNAKITEVTRNDADGANVRMTMMVLFSSSAKGSGGRSCNRVDNLYTLVREGSQLRVDMATTVTDPVSCDTE
jgi:hypothetical protein